MCLPESQKPVKLYLWLIKLQCLFALNRYSYVQCYSPLVKPRLAHCLVQFKPRWQKDGLLFTGSMWRIKTQSFSRCRCICVSPGPPVASALHPQDDWWSPFWDELYWTFEQLLFIFGSLFRNQLFRPAYCCGPRLSVTAFRYWGLSLKRNLAGDRSLLVLVMWWQLIVAVNRFSGCSQFFLEVMSQCKAVKLWEV